MKSRIEIDKEFNKKFEGYWRGNAIPDEINFYISSIRKDDIENLIEWLDTKQLKPPYDDMDFEKEEDDKLTGKSIRNAIKRLANTTHWEYRNGYNECISDVITHLNNLKENI